MAFSMLPLQIITLTIFYQQKLYLSTKDRDIFVVIISQSKSQLLNHESLLEIA